LSHVHLNIGDKLRSAYKLLKDNNIDFPLDTSKPIPFPVLEENYFEHHDTLIDIALVLLPQYGNYNFKYIGEDFIGDDTLISEGTEIYFLGYPIGLTGYELTTPIIKRGIIAGIKNKTDFYLDANAYGGNSGSPVLVESNQVNKGNGHKLIGIISSGYGEKLNLDIVIAIKVNKIIEALNEAVNKLNNRK